MTSMVMPEWIRVALEAMRRDLLIHSVIFLATFLAGMVVVGSLMFIVVRICAIT